jgi:hypothetical protein
MPEVGNDAPRPVALQPTQGGANQEAESNVATGSIRWEALTNAWPNETVRKYGPLAALGLLVVGQGIFLGVLASGLYFIWGDDSDFLLQRGTVPGVDRGLLEPHDDHWSTSVIVIYRILFHFFGMRSYVPYGLVPIALHLVLCVCLFALLRRSEVPRWLALGVTCIAIFLGVGSGAILWSTTMGLIGGLLCGIAGLVIASRSTLSWSAVRVVWVVLLLGLSFSGTGVTSVFLVTLYSFLHRGWQAALRVLSIPLLVFVSWYVMYGREGVKDPLADRWEYLKIPSFVWTGLTNPLSTATTIAEGGSVLFLLVAFAPIVGLGVPKALRDLSLACLAAAVFQLTLAAATRPAFGIQDFEGGRYAYITVVLLVPSVAAGVLALRQLVGVRRTAAAVVGCALLLGYIAQGLFLFHEEYAVRKGVTDPWPGILRGIVAASYDREAVLTMDPEDWFNWRFRPDLVAHPETWDEVPAGRATPEERLNAERLFFVGVGPQTFGQPPPEDTVNVDGFNVSTLDEGCHTYTATAEFPSARLYSESGVEMAIYGPNDNVTTHLERDGLASAPRTWQPGFDQTYIVGTSAREAELVITFDRPGDYYICA